VSDTSKIEPRIVETTEVVHIGRAPGEQYGYECATCQEVTGLQFGSHEEADRKLAEHLATEHPCCEVGPNACRLLRLQSEDCCTDCVHPR
jgi:hypothetical protein